MAIHAHAQPRMVVRRNAATNDISNDEPEKRNTRFYTRMGFGYAFPQAAQTLDMFGEPYSGSASLTNNGNLISNYSIDKASLSSGVQGGLALGYMFNSHLGIELGIQAGLANTKYSFSETGLSYQSTYIYNESFTQYAQFPLYLTPAIVLQTDIKSFTVYCRAGLVLPLNPSVIYNEVDNFVGAGPNGNNEVDKYSVEITSPFTLGFTGALGVSKEVYPHVSVWLESSLMSLSLFPDKVTYLNYYINGVNQVQGTSQFIPFGFGGTNVNPSTQSGTQQTSMLPFSNLGIHVGVQYAF
jgi:hypothetical protein